MKIGQTKSGLDIYRKTRKRFDYPGDARVINFSCYKGLPLLLDPQIRTIMYESLRELRIRHSIDFWAYVLMPEHVHFVVYPSPGSLEVGSIFGELKRDVARDSIRYLADNNHSDLLERMRVTTSKKGARYFWQPGGGYDRNETSVSAIRDHIDYIHLNPVRRGLCEHICGWSHSSAQWYSGQRPVQFEMDPTVPMVYSVPYLERY